MYTYIHTYIHTYKYLPTYIYIHIIYTYIYIYILMYINIFIYIFILGGGGTAKRLQDTVRAPVLALIDTTETNETLWRQREAGKKYTNACRTRCPPGCL